MTEQIEPIRLMASQKDQASEVLTGAFLDDPLYLQIFPDIDERSRSLRRLFGAVIGYASKYGQVHTTPSLEGAICWLSPGNTRVTFWRMLRAGLEFQRAVATFRGDTRRQLLDALAYTDEVHKRLMAGPKLDSHWYLWALGVSPASQGRGIGGALLRPALAWSDSAGDPCYLETLNERNLAFYQRQGFEVRSEEVVPGVELRVWSMIREPAV
jgi:ribosomal protein S18 acetylase RimI-like enzyme